ncbi:MAG: cytochrome c [Chlorobi bacterium]|nr:cytochrome c [Chlorobiota bacterium]
MKSLLASVSLLLLALSVTAQQTVSSVKYKFAVKVVNAIKNGNTDLTVLVDPQLEDDAKAQIVNSMLNTAEMIKSVGSPSMLKIINVLEYKDKNTGQPVLLVPVMMGSKIYTIHIHNPVEADGKWYVGGRVNFVSSEREKALTTGRKIYMAKCFSCHGKYAEGGVGPNLTDDYWKHAASNEDIYRVISDGKKGTVMMAFKNYMSKDEIRDVMLYLSMLQHQRIKKGKSPEGDKHALLRDLYINTK